MKFRREMANMSKRQQADQRVKTAEGHQLVFDTGRKSQPGGKFQLAPEQKCVLDQ